MITGIGTDIIEIKRIEAAVKGKRFLKKCYTQAEVDRCNQSNAAASENFAGYFAAKEAVAKALGTGFRGFSPADIEIIHDALGKPMVRLSENISIPKDSNIFISISHGKEHATAVAVIDTNSQSR